MNSGKNANQAYEILHHISFKPTSTNEWGRSSKSVSHHEFQSQTASQILYIVGLGRDIGKLLLITMSNFDCLSIILQLLCLCGSDSLATLQLEHLQLSLCLPLYPLSPPSNLVICLLELLPLRRSQILFPTLFVFSEWSSWISGCYR